MDRRSTDGTSTAVFIILSCGFSIILFLPSWMLGIHSISIPFAAVRETVPACMAWDHLDGSSVRRNVGILYKPNWSVTYTVAVPLIFALASAACRSARRSLIELFEDGTVSADNNDSKAGVQDFLRAISSRIRPWDRAV